MAEQNTTSIFGDFFKEERSEETVVPLPPTRPPELMEEQDKTEEAIPFPQPPVLDDVVEQEPDITRKDDTERMLEELERKRSMTSGERTSIGAPKQAGEKMTELSQDKAFMQDLRNHWYAMDGDDGLQSRDESDLAFLNRYLSDKYRGYTGNEYYTYRLVDYLNNAKDEDKLAFGRVFSRLEKDAPTLISGETTFTESAAILGDALGYGIASPTSILSYVTAAAITTSSGGTASPAAVATVAAVRKGLKSKIRSALISKAMIAAQTISAGGLGISEYGLQTAQKHGRINPSTGDIELVDEEGNPTDFDSFDTDWGQVALMSGLGYLVGTADGAAGMARATRIRAQGDRWAAKIRGEEPDVNISDYEYLDEFIDAVIGNPVSGKASPAVQSVTKVVEDSTEAGAKTRPRPLEQTLSENFVFVDNVTDELEQDMLRQMNNTEVLGAVMKFAARFEKELDKQGMLDTLGEVATTSFRGYQAKRKGSASATEVVSDAIDALGKVMEGTAPVKRTTITGEIIEDRSEEAAEKFVGIVENALETSGLSGEDFLKFMHLHTNGLIKLYDKDAKGTVGDAVKVGAAQAGRILNVQSQVSKILQDNLPAQVEADPVLKELIDRAYGSDKDRKVWKFWQPVATASRVVGKAWAGGLTSQIATTSRNIHSGTMGIATRTGVELVDSVLWHSKYAAKQAIKGNFSTTGGLKGVAQVIEDTFSLVAHMGASASPFTDVAARQKAIAIASAESDPASLKQLQRVAADITGGVSKTKAERITDKYVEALNIYNMSADIILRRGFYMHKLDKGFKQLMRKHKEVHGTEYMEGKYKNVSDFVADGNTVPDELIRDALESATMETYSNTPKNSLGRAFINTVEKGGIFTKAAIPFPRFMVSVIKHLYEYSPASPVVKGISQTMPFTENLTGDALREYTAKGIVGTGIYAYAAALLDKREEEGNPIPFNEIEVMLNDDLKEYSKDKRRIDTGPLFPLGKYLAGAKLFRAINGQDTLSMNEAKKAAELMLGINTRTGDQLKDITDAAAEAMISLFNKADVNGEDSVESTLKRYPFGEFLGEFAGGFMAFTRQARDLELAFGENPLIVDQKTRYEDSNGVIETAMQKIKGSQPSYLFGWEVNPQEGEVKNFIGNFGPKRRKLVAHKFAGLTATNDTTRIEDTIKMLGLTDKDLLTPSRSARVSNSEKYYFNQSAYQAFETIIESEAFNGDVGLDGRPYTSIQAKRNAQREMLKGAAARYSKQAKEDAEQADKDMAKEKAKQARIRFDQLYYSEEPVDPEDMKQATYDVILNDLHSVTGDRAKAKWASKSREYNVGPIENIFRERHEKAKAKYDRGEILQDFELLYHLGPTIEEQKTYGWAIRELENRTEKTERGVEEVITGQRP